MRTAKRASLLRQPISAPTDGRLFQFRVLTPTERYALQIRVIQPLGGICTMADNVTDWATAKFNQALHSAKVDLAKAQAEMTHSGQANNGRSAFPLCAIYFDHTRRTLQACTDGIATKFPNDGRARKGAVAELRPVLQVHLDRGVDTVCEYLSGRGSTREIAARHFNERRGDAEADLEQFAQGWTAPIAKGWHERHPVWWALLLLVVGAAIGQLAPVATKAAQDALGIAPAATSASNQPSRPQSP